MSSCTRQTLPDGTRKIVAVDSRGAEAGSAVIEPGRTGQPAMIELRLRQDGGSAGLARQLADAAFIEAGPGARLWDHGDDPAVQALVQRLALVPVRVLLQMRRSLTHPPLPQAQVPAGVVVRTYRAAEDDEALLRVNNAAFDWHPEQGGWSLVKLRERLSQAWVDPGGIFLAEGAAGELLGFHWTRVHPRTPDEQPLGEVYVLGVDPSEHGRGLGRALTLVGLGHLRDVGLAQAKLHVEQTNSAARATYQGLGFSVHAQDVAYAREA